MRAKQLGIPIVLGSATPSLETWYHSEHRADYRRLTLRRRVRDLSMPKVQIIDMEQEWAETKRPLVLSRTMEHLLEATFERGEQAIILMNRRGFAHRLHCPSCKTRITCPNCNVGLVPHSATGQSICHYCRARIVTPTVCPDPSCGATLVSHGAGTQRVEDVLSARFPDVHVARVDSDTMTHRRDYQRIVDDFESRRIDVLVGTQMIAKGLDFPFVSFVGVIHADAGAMSADFRAHERLFHLITQVAGRAGRAHAPGTVVVQTTTPDIAALQHALNHDYAAFATEELEARRTVGLPPFRRLARIVLSHERDRTAHEEAKAMVAQVAEVIATMKLEYADVLGPSPCILSRLKGRYRHDLLIRTHSASDLRRLLHELNQAKALATKAKSIVVDVDPVSMT
jgi:primosomal protein N' (replication factor Y)